MTTEVQVSNQTVSVDGSEGSLSITEDVPFFGQQGIVVSSKEEFLSLATAISSEVQKAWPSVTVTIVDKEPAQP